MYSIFKEKNSKFQHFSKTFTCKLVFCFFQTPTLIKNHFLNLSLNCHFYVELCQYLDTI